MALITDMRNFAESLENRGQYANASVVTKAVEVLKKQQELLQSQEQDITEITITISVMHRHKCLNQAIWPHRPLFF